MKKVSLGFVLLMIALSFVIMPGLTFAEDKPADATKPADTTKPADATKPADTKAAETVKVNINTADAKELATVKGIGQKLAERIVKYRTEKAENGKFKSLDELKNVKGIKSKTFDKIKDHLTI